ncbi:glycoside hydrolase family 24 protein [Pseudomonas sp. MT3]
MPRISAAEAGGQNVLAFLDMLAWSEGTSTNRGSDDGYNVVVGGGLFQGYADHPRQSIYLPRLNIRSTAAGRYQLLSRYWDAYRKSLGLTGGFTPENQDRVALQQISERKALDDIKAGRVREAIAKCRNIWASLPGAGYQQHEHKLEDLVQQYRAAGGVVA